MLLLCLHFLFIFISNAAKDALILMYKEKKKRMIPKKRALHELPYKEIVKSGTIRLVSGQGLYCVTLPWRPLQGKFYVHYSGGAIGQRKNGTAVTVTLELHCIDNVTVQRQCETDYTVVWTAVTERHYKESFTMELQYRYEKKEWHCSDNVKLIVERTAVTEWHCSDIEQPAANFNFYNKNSLTLMDRTYLYFWPKIF